MNIEINEKNISTLIETLLNEVQFLESRHRVDLEYVDSSRVEIAVLKAEIADLQEQIQKLRNP